MIRQFPRPGIITPFRGSKRPLWPFALNRDSDQSENLAAWFPIVPGGASLNDIVSGIVGTLTGIDPDAGWVSDDQFIHVLDFERGSSHYVALGTQPSLNLTGECTISAWIKPESTGNGTAQIVADCNIGANTTQWNLEFDRTSGRLSMLADTGNVAVTGSSTLSSGTWYLATGRRSGTTSNWTYKVFVNGVEDGTGATAINFNAQSTAAIGRLGAFGIHYFDGLIADVRIYRSACDTNVINRIWDPRTRWDLYYPLRQRVWCFPTAAAAGVVVGRNLSYGSKLNRLSRVG